jgi:type III restriction enzyme
MSEFEVPQPIICSPFEEPARHWHIEEGAAPTEPVPGRRPAHYFYRPPGADPTSLSASAAGSFVGASGAAGVRVELPLVNLIRTRIKEWRTAEPEPYPGATATTLELLQYWRRDGRLFRPFFAQLEAIETIIFLKEARRDFLQGIDIPLDEPSDQQKADKGYKAFQRFACKMATGSGTRVWLRS